MDQYPQWPWTGINDRFTLAQRRNHITALCSRIKRCLSCQHFYFSISFFNMFKLFSMISWLIWFDLVKIDSQSWGRDQIFKYSICKDAAPHAHTFIYCAIYNLYCFSVINVSPNMHISMINHLDQQTLKEVHVIYKFCSLGEKGKRRRALSY